MTMPTPALTWAVEPGAVIVSMGASALATIRQTLVALVAEMVASGFATVNSSCDSVVAGTIDDGVNRWDSPTDVVGNTPGSVHSWFLMDTPRGQVLIDRDGVTDGAGSVYWSATSSFTGGSTTARPTAADEVEISQDANIIHTTNGQYDIHTWRCATAGSEGYRFAAFNSNIAAGPVIMFQLEVAGGDLAAWSPRTIARWMAGASAFGDRADFTTFGWQSRIAGTTRQLLADGIAPQASADPDGDRLVEGCGLNNVTIGDVGFVNDMYFVDDAVTSLLTYSDSIGARAWIVLDEVIWPWDRTTVTASGNTAAVKLRRYYAAPSSDATAPTIALVQPAAEGNLDATYERAKYLPLIFDVTDISPGVQSITVTLLFDADIAAEYPYEIAVYRRGSFRRGWTGSVVAIADGFRVTVNPPARGWPGDFLLGVDVVDGDGNEDA